MLHYVEAFSGEAASSEGRRVPVPQAARSARSNSTLRSTSSSASTSRGTRSSTELAAEHRPPTRRIRRGGLRPHSRRPSSASPSVADAAHAPRDQSDPSCGATAPDGRRLGGDRRALSPSNGDPRFSVDNDEEFRPAVRADPESRAGGVVGGRLNRTSRATRQLHVNARFGRFNQRFITSGRHEDHAAIHQRKPAGIGRFGAARRRSPSPSMLAAAGAASAFDIQHRQSGHRDALGQHVPLQPRRSVRSRRTQASSAVRTSTTATAISATDRSSPIASTCCPSSTSSTSASTVSACSGAGWYDFAYRHLDNNNNATANTLVDGLPVAGMLSPYTKRYAKGLSGEFLDAFAFTTSTSPTCRSTSRPASTPCTGATACFSAARSTAFRTAQNSIDVWKGFATPGSEAKELFRPRGGLTLQAQPTNDLSVAGQWFYNWQAIRIPESGSYLTINDPLNFGGESFIFGPNPLGSVGSRRAGIPAPVEHEPDIKPPNESAASAISVWRRAGVPHGSTARWASTTAMRRTSCRRRWPRRASSPRCLPALLGHRRHAAAGGTNWHRQPATPRRLRTCSSSASSARTTARTATTSTSTASALRRVRRRQLRRRALVSPEHAARERTRCRCCRRRSCRSCPVGSPRRRTSARHAGRAGRHVARPDQRHQHLPKDRAVRHCALAAELRGCSGRRSRRTRRCSRGARIT